MVEVATCFLFLKDITPTVTLKLLEWFARTSFIVF